MPEPTASRAAGLAAAIAKFPMLGEIVATDLTDLVRLELGHAEILDAFRPYGDRFARAIPPGNILHIVSGNTPHAALQSLTRGLLLGSHNRVKLPTGGLPDVAAFLAALPAELAARVECSETLPDSWLREGDAVIVFGSDETIAHFRARVPVGIPFQAHGHRVSLGIVFDDPDCESVEAAARDISLYDQHGCLSPHDIFVRENNDGFARTYAARLAEAMARFNAHTPRRALTIGEAAAISDLRASYTFRSASDVRTQIWQSENSTDWTVIYEDDPWFATSPLDRVVFVKPLPVDFAAALEPVRSWLGAIGIWPATIENAERVAGLGAARICSLGRMQFPPASWHAEGIPNLGSLVRWIDFEPAP
ncbi:MAG: acyl-CoA reductase [Chthoniobacterales bacterium]